MNATALRLARIRRGDVGTLAEAFDEHRSCLKRIISFRLDRRLSGRVDAEDVLQEAFLSAAERCRYLLGDTARSLFVWLRLIVLQTLADVHRRHLQTQKRDASREWTSATTRERPLAAGFGSGVTVPAAPPDTAEQMELAERLLLAVGRLQPLDQQVLVLRHVHELSNYEVAARLGINPKAASIRYSRALRRLKALVSSC